MNQRSELQQALADRDHAREEREKALQIVRTTGAGAIPLDVLGIILRAEKAEAERDQLQRDVDYHAECRPNRRQAEAAIADAKAMNDKWADEVTARRQAEADLLSAREELATLKESGRCLGCRADLHDGAGTCAPCAASDTLAYQTETAMLREELATLKAEREGLITDKVNAKRAAADAYVQTLRWGGEVAELTAELARLQPYVQHKSTCDVRTDKGGGLSENIIVMPKCTCGLIPLEQTEEPDPELLRLQAAAQRGERLTPVELAKLYPQSAESIRIAFPEAFKTP